jgi:hypothetical protein
MHPTTMKENFQIERKEDGKKKKMKKYNTQQDGEDDNSISLIYN